MTRYGEGKINKEWYSHIKIVVPFGFRTVARLFGIVFADKLWHKIFFWKKGFKGKMVMEPGYFYCPYVPKFNKNGFDVEVTTDPEDVKNNVFKANIYLDPNRFKVFVDPGTGIQEKK
jgi:hypothetical protein